MAYYFNWSHDEILNLEHKERVRFCKEISKINKKMNGDAEEQNIFDIF